MFISMDGGDGTGKSTQIRLLEEHLRRKGMDVLVCRDPGSTPLGEAVRQILLNRKDLLIGDRAEMLLFMAARAQLVQEVILPALNNGKIVLSDRYLFSNIVYQGYAGGLSVEELWDVGMTATQHILPDLAVILDIPREVALSRLQERNLDRMELKGDDYHERVRNGFLDCAQSLMKKQDISVFLVDASGTEHQVAALIAEKVDKLLH